MWLFLAIISYFFLSVSSFVDKYLLGGALPSPKTYVFYSGFFSLAVLLIIPLGILASLGVMLPIQSYISFSLDFSKIFFIPSWNIILLSLLTGFSFIISLYIYYKGAEIFEISRIAPAVGGLAPIFTLSFSFLASSLPLHLSSLQRGKLDPFQYLAFSLLILGSVVLSIQKKKKATLKSLEISALSALFLGLYFVLMRIVYFLLPFWVGFIWIRTGMFILAFSFIIFPEVRDEVFHGKKGVFRKKIALPLLLGKTFGGTGAFLQNGAVFLVPLMDLPLINALSGIQYVFLLILATSLYFKFPKILKEQVSKGAISQKIFGVIIISLGLAFMFF